MSEIILSSTALLFTISYSIYLLVRRDRSFSSSVLAVALVALGFLELFDLLALARPESLFLWKKCSLLAESILPLSWLLFSITYARLNEARSISILQKICILLSCCAPVAAAYFPARSLFYSPDFTSEHILFLSNNAFYFYVGFLLFIVISLINLEVTLANSSRGNRWKIKLEILGAMSILAGMLFYYSQGLLYRTINMNLVPVRSLLLVIAVGLMAYSRIFRGNGVRIYVSKQMAFKSVVLLAVGLYLVGLGLMGEGMRYFGGNFQRTMALTIAFLAGIGLLVMLLSQTIKRKIKVFLHRNFYKQKYDYRTQWLQFTDRLASSNTGDDLLNAIVYGFAEVFGMGCGALFLYDDDGGTYGIAATLEIEQNSASISRKDPLIEVIEGKKNIIDLRVYRDENEIELSNFITVNTMVFIIPLLVHESLEGFVMLGRPLSADEIFDYEDYDLMTTLSRQAASAILNLRLSDELMKAREMEAVGKLSAFILHDLKNLCTTLALIVDNARNFMDNPEFRIDMLESLENTVIKMNSLILRLKKLEEKKSLQREPADLLDLSRKTAGLITNGEILVSGEPACAEIDSEEMQKLLLNLIINAIEATGGNGPVTLEVGCLDMAIIKVRDEGCGMSDEFIKKHLFKPFRTTKKKGLGIGLYQCKQIVEAHGGLIEVESKVGNGTTFTIRLPIGGVGLKGNFYG